MPTRVELLPEIFDEVVLVLFHELLQILVVLATERGLPRVLPTVRGSVIARCVFEACIIEAHQLLLLAYFLLYELCGVEPLAVLGVSWWYPDRSIRMAHLERQLGPSSLRVTIEERECSPSVVVDQILFLVDEEFLESPVL